MGLSAEESTLVPELLFEPLTFPINKAYRGSFLRSFLALLYFYGKSRLASAPMETDSAAGVWCLGVFRNELRALEEAVAIHPDWQLRHVNLRELTGMDWARVFRPAPMLIAPFLVAAARTGGRAAVRNFIYPFIGLLLFRHLRERFAHGSRQRVIVTSNFVHPLSVGIHKAALSAGLRTYFWEHAMTPRFMAKERGFEHHFVRCEHTRRNFLAGGVPASKLTLIRGGEQERAVELPVIDGAARIGVSINDLDEVADVEETLQLLRRLGKNVVLRVHDSDRRLAALKLLAREQRADFSSAVETPICEFLEDVDIVIAGNTNVVLDCVRAKRPIIYYWPGDPQLFDYYGIVEAAGCARAQTLQELTNLIVSRHRGPRAVI